MVFVILRIELHPAMSIQKDQQSEAGANFIHAIIEEDILKGKNEGRVHTRFPPEPNGHLHIGHAKSICLNFGTAEKFEGLCNLRFDDTNPSNEEEEYVEAIKEDIKWLGFSWGDREYYASDYFDELYDYAVMLVGSGKAYVDDQSIDEISEGRGTPTQPGKPSPNRDRSAEENLELLTGMKTGKFSEGSRVLRAKIDMDSPNMHLRDPVMYRIKSVPHHRTGETWSIYPMYDWAHGQSDSLEGITHSVCTLEFEVHRPLYEWFIENLKIFPSQQYEFARLNLSYTVLSKRKLIELVNLKIVGGWDDPRMPTISGLRRRGYTPASIRTFCDRIGVARREQVVDVALLEFSVRDHLNRVAPRRMAIQRPIKLIITNYPEGQKEYLEAVNNPEILEAGKRLIPFSRELLIEEDDFMLDPPSKFFRLAPGREVRLKYAYIIKCDDFKTDEAGNVLEIYCTYDAETRSGGTSNRKVKGTLSWVSERHSIKAELRLYDRLFLVENPLADRDKDFKEFLNPHSLEVLSESRLEPGLAEVRVGETYQFERQGYFCVDSDSNPEKLVFNRTVTLRDSWARKLRSN